MPRFRSTRMHLTYEHHYTVDEILQFLNTKNKVVEHSFVCERSDKEHAYDHTHVLVRWERKPNFRERSLDYNGIHPHIKSVFTPTHWNNVLQYHKKAPLFLEQHAQKWEKKLDVHLSLKDEVLACPTWPDVLRINNKLVMNRYNYFKELWMSHRPEYKVDPLELDLEDYEQETAHIMQVPAYRHRYIIKQFCNEFGFNLYIALDMKLKGYKREKVILYVGPPKYEAEEYRALTLGVSNGMLAQELYVFALVTPLGLPLAN